MSSTSFPMHTLAFGRCSVSFERRELAVDGALLELGGRSFDILAVLAEERGRVVSKDELIQRVWPGRVVEENTLEAQVSALRKALAADRAAIRTVSGRGYQFVAELLPTGATAAPLPTCNLPASISDFLGRDAELSEVIDLIDANRLFTLVGTGGIGKTRLALEAARCLAIRFPDGVTMAELGPVSDAEFVPMAVAEAFGFPPGAGTASLDRIASGIKNKRMLLVLDNCEHLIEAAARIAHSLLKAAANIHIVATSREALRVEGEYVYRVTSLQVPGEQNADVPDILRHGAVQLFEARAGFMRKMPEMSLDAAALISRICRRLDGIPLAIELAAARAQMLGIQGLADRLDDRFRLFNGGSRTALPRQQTLRATLDWSYDLLPDAEKTVLNRLGVFASAFAFEAAVSVAGCSRLSQDEVVDCVTNLAQKSLVSVDTTAGASRYRLLESTQIYAREKLQQCGEQQAYEERHARYILSVLELAEAKLQTRSAPDWLAEYGCYLDDVRTAIRVSFGRDARSRLGVALTCAAVPLWQGMALVAEYLGRVDYALDCLDENVPGDAQFKMKFYAARGSALVHHAPIERRPDNEGFQHQFVLARTPLADALAIAEELGNVEYQLRALWGLWAVAHVEGRYGDSTQLSQRFAALSPLSATPSDQAMAHRLLGVTQLALGNLAPARQELERMLELYAVRSCGSDTIRFVYEPSVTANCALAHVLWLQGLPAQASDAVGVAVARARALNHLPSMCYAITEATAIALLVGGIDAVAKLLPALQETMQRSGFMSWKQRGQLWSGFVLFCAGDAAAYERDFRPIVDTAGNVLFAPHSTGLVSAAALELARQGRVTAGLALTSRAIGFFRGIADACLLPEWLRIEAEIYLLQDLPDARALAESRFREGLQISMDKQLHGWELRCASSLARLLADTARGAEALQVLEPVCLRSAAGGNSVDLERAKTLLTALR